MHSVAFYPGAFDPFHLGHLKSAEKVSELVDKVFIAPNLDNPDSIKHHAKLEDRVSMIKEGIKGKKRLSLYLPSKNVYLLEGEKRFRYHSFRWFMDNYLGCKGYILMGSDKLKQDMYLDTSSELLSIPHILFLRDVLSNNDIKTLNNFLDILIIPFYNKISSGFIRENLKNKELIKQFIHEDVMNYIIKNKLYGFS